MGVLWPVRVSPGSTLVAWWLLGDSLVCPSRIPVTSEGESGSDTGHGCGGWEAVARFLPSSSTRLCLPSGCLWIHQASVEGEGPEWPGKAGDPVRLGRRPCQSVVWTSCLVPGPGSRLRPPALCAPLRLPCPRALSLHCSPSFLSSVLLFSLPRSLLPSILCLPTLLLCPPSRVSIFLPPSPHLCRPLPWPLSPFLSLFLAFSRVCLSVPGLCLPSLPPSLPAGLSPSLPCPASSVSLSPCLSLPLLSGKAAVIYELRTGPAAGAGGLDYSFPEEAACSGMAG